jgi:hypothetical protein
MQVNTGMVAAEDRRNMGVATGKDEQGNRVQMGFGYMVTAVTEDTPGIRVELYES